ncbi:MAG: polynucleotide adenylyltransferase PcnB [Myxococcales bacterium]|nr:polynucleotide adenylyltransferase PcnB [Myxococcales bacterium]
MDHAEPIRLREHRIKRRDIERDALRVLRRLYDFGFHAYLVGGSVRDLLLDRQPKDFDVVTSARPAEIRRLFRRCRLIGRRFRLAHILGENGLVIETATFRAKPAPNGETTLIVDDNQFGTPASDAHRRDFTVNALFYDPATDEVIDYVGGLADLDARVLRTIGDPVVRFREDPVRMLRAAKFAARLGFSLDDAGREAVLAERGELCKAAVPRLYEELIRMLWSGGAAASITLLDELRLLELLVPELCGYFARTGEAGHAIVRALLEGIDRRFADDAPTPHGLLLAALYWPMFRALIEAMPQRPSLDDHRPLAEALTLPIARRLSVPRRTIETVVRVLEGQFRIERPPNRRGGRAALARDPEYDAIATFAKLRAEAGDLTDGHHAAWRAQLDEHVPGDPEHKRGRPRRRRRRGS